VLTDTPLRTSMTQRLNRREAGHAIDHDEFRSSNWLRTKDFQRHGLRGHHRFGWFRDNGFTGAGFRRRSR
jgi:hypothetical protein